MITSDWVDDGLTKKACVELPEDTRPVRMLRKKFKDKTRKPQGRKKKHTDRPAQYHNWFTPVCWRMIKQACQIAGWRMSPTEIVKRCKQRNQEVFKGLTRETVRLWIDRTGDKPRWSDETLKCIQAGNVPGHHNGGCKGVFVSRLKKTKSKQMTNLSRPHSQRLWRKLRTN